MQLVEDKIWRYNVDVDLHCEEEDGLTEGRGIYNQMHSTEE